MFAPHWLDVKYKSPTTFAISVVLSLRVHPHTIKVFLPPFTLDTALVSKNTRLLKFTLQGKCQSTFYCNQQTVY